jgi:hypothetical protein
MGALNLLPLVVLALVVGGIGWVLYQVCFFPSSLSLSLSLSRTCCTHTHTHTHTHTQHCPLLTRYKVYMYSNELAERGVRKMEKKNVIFTKDGAKVGVKEMSAEDVTDRTQRAFVKTWNAANDRPQSARSRTR